METGVTEEFPLLDHFDIHFFVTADESVEVFGHGLAMVFSEVGLGVLSVELKESEFEPAVEDFDVVVYAVFVEITITMGA